MGKTAYRRLSESERVRVMSVAKEMFSIGHSAMDVCHRFNIAYSTLKHLCAKDGITIPRQRHGS